MRYFFHIAYDGSGFRGWQRQPGITTVQETLEDCLGRALKKRVYCIGCGRTDAQVHASNYYFHIDAKEELGPNFKFIVNKMLGADIAVLDIFPANIHAQHDALERTYDYHIHTKKNPFLSKYSAYYPLEKPDLVLMQQAVALLPQHREYRAFCKTPDKHNHTLVEVFSAQINSNEAGDKFHFQITANRFLRGMIRILVARIIEVGKGRLSLETFQRYLNLEEDPEFMNLAYPQGLYLSKVLYPVDVMK